MSESAGSSSGIDFRFLKKAKVLWPPEMPDDMVDDAINIAHQSLQEFNIDKEGTQIAQKIKKEFDERWGPYWHVTVGKNFGSYAVHEKQRFLYFYINQVAFMIYKAG
eukprot:GHVQ01009053.1.p2 GENE.GHVQ01009053.1~~GHVQ01009053.1.p2  ORF type:complete len:107 (+),score=10.45 GHVQ01009053.1:287-607(+)